VCVSDGCDFQYFQQQAFSVVLMYSLRLEIRSQCNILGYIVNSVAETCLLDVF